MSLGRRGDAGYLKGYLRSPAWFDRRRAWFRSVVQRGQVVVCLVCREAGPVDLHHTSYDGVRQESSGEWVAGEADEDLMPLCRGCHEDLHRELDRRRRDFWGWDRRRASAVIVIGLRRARLGSDQIAASKGRRGWTNR